MVVLLLTLNHYIIRNASTFGLDQKKIASKDIHINALCYSIKKAGTSGGLAIASAIVSLLLDKAVPADVAFTGEIDLHGDILKVSGIKEKIIGAYNNNYKKVFIPIENENDLIRVPENIKNQIEIICVESFEDVYNDLFKKHK